jgi:hypothetical protein
MKKILFAMLCLSMVYVQSCQTKSPVKIEAYELHQWNIALQEGITNDFFSPPVASRMYTYPNIAVFSLLHPEEYNQVIQDKTKPKPIAVNKDILEVVAMYTFYHVAIKMIYTIQPLDDYKKQFDSTLLAKDYDQSQLQEANTTAEAYAKQFLAWAAADGYKETRSDSKYVLKNTPGSWKPTPPDYMDALEPNWHKIRPFMLDSATEYVTFMAPYPYDVADKNSNFYKEMLEVYEQVSKTDSEQNSIGKFWDCNPLAPQHVSHVSYAEKKLTPGGHWITIARIISTNKKENLLDASKMYCYLSMSIADAFIACWTSKYHYNYIRPVTVINETISPTWKSIITTPNFPEYPSGHSVVSGTASTILNQLYGKNTPFTDNSEEPYGMKPRTFNSFDQACEEAAMSRFYAGIHFKKAIVDGQKMGRSMGKKFIQKLKL